MEPETLILACAMAEATARAAAAVEIPAGAGAPGEIMLMPPGRVETRPNDSRKAWSNPDAEAVVAASQQMRSDLPIDYDHQTQFAQTNGQPAPAAGWIRKLFARAGAVWGEVEWTERGRQAVETREYRFISPTFLFEKASRKVKLITGAGLTNNPALFMEALASAQEGDPDMDLEKLRKALGLSNDATVEQILAAATAAAAAQTAIVTVAKTLGLEDGATADQVTEAATAATAGMTEIAKAAGLEGAAKPGAIATAVAAARAGGSDPDPTRFVPRAEFERVSGRVTELETAGVEEKATAAVDTAIRAGKFPPTTREHYLKHARRDLQDFEALAAATPAMLETGALMDDRRPPADPDAELTKDELTVCRAMGIKPEDYKATRKAMAEAEEAA